VLEFNQSTRLSPSFRRVPGPWALLIALATWVIVSTAHAAPPPPPTAAEGEATEEADGAQPPAEGEAPAAGAEDATSPAPTATPPKPTTDSTAPNTAERQSEIYGERLDGLQAEVNDLKDRIFRSKARLAVLKETVLHGVVAGSRIIVAHRNLMSSQFKLVKLVYLLDGAQIYAKSDESGALDSEDELIVFDGNLPVGQHQVTIQLEYKGVGFGIFSYLNGYTFDARSSHSFAAPQNGALKLLSVGFERGNLTTEMKDRPAVDWQALALDASGKPLPRARNAKKGK
jgi:hypothetical protein